MKLDLETVENIRHLVRPVITVWALALLSTLLVVGCVMDKLDWVKAVMVAEGILATIIGYHFGKSSKVDEGVNGNSGNGRNGNS